MSGALDQAAETAKGVFRAAGDAMKEAGSEIQNAFDGASSTQVRRDQT